MICKNWVRMGAGCACLIFLIPVVSGCGGDAQAKKIAHFQRGNAYFADAKYAEAVIEFKNAIQLNPKDAQAHYKLGLAYLKKGGLSNLQQAFQAFRKSTDLDPKILDPQLKLGELYLLSKRFDKAGEKVTLVLKDEPNHVEAHLLLGNVYAGQQQLDKAITELRRALTLDPKLIKAYLNLATLHLVNKDVDAAETNYLS